VFTALRDTVCSPHRQAKNWAGHPLMGVGGRTEIEAGTIIKAWIGSGVLAVGEYNHQANRNTVDRVTLDETKAAEIMAELEVAVAPSD
jgi:hypothetical protein